MILTPAYERLVMNICACAAASIETMLSRDALSETASPRRQRASCNREGALTFSDVRTLLEYGSQSWLEKMIRLAVSKQLAATVHRQPGAFRIRQASTLLGVAEV